MEERARRFFVVLTIALAVIGGSLYASIQDQVHDKPRRGSAVPVPIPSGSALEKLSALPIKGRAPKTGYAREQFAADWADIGGCDMRNYILKRDMTNASVRSEVDCTVMSGSLNDPYTGKVIQFTRGAATSDDVQIDHVVALSDAWQKGAQQLDEGVRAEFFNDPLNLLAVDGPTNMKKGDSDAASWLPPNKDYRCRYIARQVSVKAKYSIWVTQAERDAMKEVLQTCPTQALPTVE